MPSGGRPPPQGSHFSSSALHIVLGQVKKEGGDINGTSEQDLLSRVGRVDNGPHISCCAITAGGLVDPMDSTSILAKLFSNPGN